MQYTPLTPHPFKPARACAVAAALAAALLAAPAHAATCTWSGAASSNMNDAGNWSCPGGGGNMPGTDDTLIFPAGAGTQVLNHNMAAPAPAYGTASFAPGYTLSGPQPFVVKNGLNIEGEFTNFTAIDSSLGAADVIITGTTPTGMTLTYAPLNNMASISVQGGNAGSTAHALIAATTGSPSILIHDRGIASLGNAVNAAMLTVNAGGTLRISEPRPGANNGDTVGSATVTGATTLAAGSTLEYRALTSFDPGMLTAQGGIALNGATLRIVVEDPANPDAIGFQRTLVGYGDSTKLTGTFAGLPANGALIQASNAPGVWYAISYGSNSNAFIQITRAAAPVVPPGGGGGPAAIPALAPAGLALLSAGLAGMGMVRRRKRG